MFKELDKPNTEQATQCDKPFTKTLTSAFSLIELLIALVVFSLLVTMALPSFNSLLLNGRLSANMNALVNALNYARSTALNQSVAVKVCPFNALNSTSCGGSWNTGWILATQPAIGAPVLLKSQQIGANDGTLSANVGSVLFDTHGLVTTTGNFTICDSRGGAFARSVEVIATGYIQSGPTPGTAVWNSGALTCP